MSSAIDLQVSRSLEQLARLKEVTAGFAKQDEQLTRALSSRRVAIDRTLRESLEKIEVKREAERAEIEALFHDDEQRVRQVHQRRESRIQRTSAAGLRSLPRRAQDWKEKWIGQLQMRHFQAGRKLSNDLAAADVAFTESSAWLAQQAATLAELTRRAGAALRGYRSFRRSLAAEPSPIVASNDPFDLAKALSAEIENATGMLGAFREIFGQRFFGFAPLPILLAGVIAAALVIGFLSGGSKGSAIAGAVGLLVAGIFFVLHQRTQRAASESAESLGATLRQALRLQHACRDALVAKRQSDHAQANEEHDATLAEIQEQWERADQVEVDFETAGRAKIETQMPRAKARSDALFTPKLARIVAARAARLEQLQTWAETRARQLRETHATETAALAADEEYGWAELEAKWKGEIVPLYQTIETSQSAAAPLVPEWNMEAVEQWTPPVAFPAVMRFGQLALDLAQRTNSVPRNPRLSLPGSAQVSIPLALTFPAQGSLLFETRETGSGVAPATLNGIILRLLATTPPGKISFTIIDPVGLGHNFAGLMHLADYEESLINRRIWTQREQIEERLAEMGEHIEKVIQMYLRNEYATITEYNQKAGSVAEKYHFLVVADFPADFSEVAAKRLQSIALSGPRCGIFTLIHWDQRQPLPDGFVPAELRKNSVCLRREKGEWLLTKEQAESGARVVLDPPPDPEIAATLIHKIGQSSVDSTRVEVPFAQIAPKPGEFWTNETTSELRIAVGRTGATKLQYLAIGKGTRQHALFAGKTGSGKSTLFHVIITNLALACSPEQVEFYLIDFKKGVEFKCYATKGLPHARVVAIESDREFALSVLQRVDAELKRRGDMFRKLGVQDIAGYKKAGGTEPVPRSLLLIDEFQEFFVEDDTIAQNASLLFDRIVRQGRAFGIHVLLGSQSLGGAYSLARATIGQMVIRVALQCNEADAYLIMDDNNSAPRLLSRPGEGIYNDAGGAMEGNSPFQVVWLPDDERDAWLDRVTEFAKQQPKTYPLPMVFEGNAPADIRENETLRAILDAPPVSAPAVARVWLGAPNSIKGPTEAIFQRRSGNHLLIVGQSEETEATMIGLSLLALAAQYPVGTAGFVLVTSEPAGSASADFFERITYAFPHDLRGSDGHDLAAVMEDLSVKLKERTGAARKASPIFVFVHGLQRFKKLRHEDDFGFSSSTEANPGAVFNEIIAEGSSHGIHLMVSVDTFNNVNRFLSRKALGEFEVRVVFQMSANDSASLVDSPKASTLGLHRALFYNEQQGLLETFRPYAMPSSAWMDEVTAKMERRKSGQS